MSVSGNQGAVGSNPFEQLGSNMKLAREEEIDRVWCLWKGWVDFKGSNLWPWHRSQNWWRTFACDRSLRFESKHMGHRCHCMYSLQPRLLLRLDWFVNHGDLKALILYQCFANYVHCLRLFQVIACRIQQESNVLFKKSRKGKLKVDR